MLIVEDSEDDAALVLRELRREGYDPRFERVQTAAAMREALLRVQWEIILSDYSMPQFNALQALEVLKASGLDIPFILISGTVGEETAVAAMRAGASDYLLKDNLGRLIPAIERELNEARIRSERRNAEQALAGLQELFRTVIEASPVPIAAVDLEGSVLVWNNAAQRVFGWSAGEVLGRPVPIVTEKAQAGLQALRGEGITGLEIRGRKRDGTFVDLHLSTSPMRDHQGNIYGVVQILEDITERKRAEDALRDSEERYRLLFASNPQPMWVYDLETLRFLEVNDAAVVHYGYSREEFLAMTIKDIRPPQDVHALLKNVARAGGGIDKAGVWRHRKRDGSLIEVEITSHRVDFGGRRGELVLANDITERRRAEEALRESERRLSEVAAFNQRVIDSSTVGISTFDAVTGQCMSANAVMAKIIGGTIEQVRGLNFRQAEPWKKTGLLETADRALLNGAEQRRETHVVTSFGKDVWLDCSLVPFNIERRPHVLLMVHDITERKRADDRLRESEEQFRLIAENVADLIAVLDLDGRRVYNSPSYKTILGDVEGARGTVSFNEIHPDDREKIKRIFEETVRSGVGQRGEFRFLLKDGSIRFIESQGSVIRDREGKVAKVVVVSRDVTGRKMLEQQLLQAQKMEAIGQLAGGVAHDFNNLLTVINGYSHLILERLDPESPYRSPIVEIQKAGGRAASLTRQLLAFSRRQILAPQTIDLNAVVSDLEKMLRRLIGEDIILETNLYPNLGKVHADPGQIEQVIMNLVVNARDATPQGGRITIETSNVELGEEYVRTHHEVSPGRYVMLGVSDTGHGMDAETQTHIFEPFFTTKEKGKGTGLGLSTVYGIVRQSGGSIWAYSELGHGTVFKVYMPRIDEARERKEQEQINVAPARGGNETILITEDQDAVRLLVYETLKSKGYEVLEASGGEDALRIGRGHGKPIHLLVTDVVMPGMSGREVARNLEHLNPRMKVLYMSGYADDAIVRHGALEKGLSFIQKPFTPAALAHKVREVLDQP